MRCAVFRRTLKLRAFTAGGFAVLAWLTVLGQDPSTAPRAVGTPSPAASLEEQEIRKDLQALHKAMTAYLVDHGGAWPQAPKIAQEDDDGIVAWLKNELRPYGASEEHWILGEGKSLLKAGNTGRPRVAYDYLPTAYDGAMLTPYRFAGQPWFVTLTPLSLLILPDGSVVEPPDMGEIQPNGKLQAKEAFPGASKPLPLTKIPEALRPLAIKLGWK